MVSREGKEKKVKIFNFDMPLQTLRDSGRLPHSKINNRIYYRPEDVERLIADCNDV